MKHALAGAVLWASLSGAAPAQVAPSTPPPNTPPAPGSLEPGANSFTEGQAKSRLERMGYSEIGQLKQDEHGIWRGRALYGGRQVEVGVDYRGAITRE